MLIENVRLPAGCATASAGTAARRHDRPTDLRIEDGSIVELGEGLRAHPGEERHDAAGAVAIPGLWDHHVHVGQAAEGWSRLDTSGAESVDGALDLVRAALAGRARGGEDAKRAALVGFGHRDLGLDAQPAVQSLDAIAPDLPVVLISADAHHAWMNTAALDALGLARRSGPVGEDEWFRAVPRLDALPGVAEARESGVERLQTEALAKGVVGITDMEWADNARLWRARRARLRVLTATYAATLDVVPGPSGTAISADGLVRMGPLKVIVDGALGSRTARCRHAYGAHGARSTLGTLNVSRDELAALLERGARAGLDTALHAIGDAAAGVVLDALEGELQRTGRGDRRGRVGEGRAPGQDAPAGGAMQTGLAGLAPAARHRMHRIEHAQLLTDDDLARMARLGAIASVQPAHLIDDRDTIDAVWADRAGDAFRLRDLLDAGVPLEFGSDAPVAPIDPWLAMALAVHRSADERAAWHPEQQLQPLEALRASTNGIAELAVGGPGDVVLIDDDVFGGVDPGDEGAARAAAARLRGVRPRASFVAGRLAG